MNDIGRRTRLLSIVMAAAWFVSSASCHQAILTAPPGSTITLTANPESIPAYGGVSVISALVYEATGAPVADGTVVQFFTTLGKIQEQAKTNDGVARVNLLSDGQSGEAEVTAFSGGGVAGSATGTSGSSTTTSSSGASASTKVTIGAGLAANVLVVAVPTTLTTRRTADIIANVFDTDGNPLSRVPVIFTVMEGADKGPAQYETMASGGRAVFTDNNGCAFDVLRTTYPDDADQRFVTVTATTGNNNSDSVQVQINIGFATPTPKPTATPLPTATPTPSATPTPAP